MNNLTELNYKEVNKMLTVPVFLGQYLVELSASSRVLSMTCRCDFLLEHMKRLRLWNSSLV